jgi:drug/metabolite transporter (DMT)-like permease
MSVVATLSAVLAAVIPAVVGVALGNHLTIGATGRGQLAIVAVLTALYPAVTVLLARAFLAERWTHGQAAGLLTAAAAVILVAAG